MRFVKDASFYGSVATAAICVICAVVSIALGFVSVGREQLIRELKYRIEVSAPRCPCYYEGMQRGWKEAEAEGKAKAELGMRNAESARRAETTP